MSQNRTLELDIHPISLYDALHVIVQSMKYKFVSNEFGNKSLLFLFLFRSIGNPFIENSDDINPEDWFVTCMFRQQHYHIKQILCNN